MKEMEDNYLLDRSGEPDSEVQELEEILGTLRYQPQPLEIPKHIRVGRRRTFFPAMAIAAAIALFAILLGLWFNFNRRQTAQPLQATQGPQAPSNATTQPPQLAPDNQASAQFVNRTKPTVIQKRRESPRNLLAANKNRGTHTQIQQPGLTAQELAEKEQVLIALRLVSAKLNLAQRKTQGAPQFNTIRNQHKIG
jgi:hypothetical protein